MNYSKKPKKQAPCVLFIDDKTLHRKDDELDLNISDIDPIDGVIVIGASEDDPDEINYNLAKWCSFKTTIEMHAPDARARKQIIEHYLKKFGKAGNCNTHDIEVLVKTTSGYDFGHLKNIIEYAVFASMDDTTITNDHFERGRQKIIYDKFSTAVLPTKKLQMETAYHEAGHAIVWYYTPNCPELDEVTILSSVNANGLTSFKRDGDYLRAKAKLYSAIDVAMGGLVAEELICGSDELTYGPVGDINFAKRLAKSIVRINYLCKSFPDDEKVMI